MPSELQLMKVNLWAPIRTVYDLRYKCTGRKLLNYTENTPNIYFVFVNTEVLITQSLRIHLYGDNETNMESNAVKITRKDYKLIFHAITRKCAPANRRCAIFCWLHDTFVEMTARAALPIRLLVSPLWIRYNRNATNRFVTACTTIRLVTLRFWDMLL